MSILTSLKNIITHLAPGTGTQQPPDRELRILWSGSLTSAGLGLKEIISSTEAGFLSIGESLQSYYSRSQEMTGRSQTIMELMTGEGLSQATAGLSVILDDLTVQLGDSEGHFARIKDELQRYSSTLKKAFSYLDGFDMLVLNLTMLGFLTRVENAHIYTTLTGFSSLTDDVKGLSENIRQKSGTISTQATEAHTCILHALTKIEGFKKNKGSHAGDTLQSTMGNHRALTDKYSSASRSSKLIAERTSQITSSIGEIVMSLQFHDITRQQIEHVHEVLDSLCTRINSQEEGGTEQAGLVREVVELQASQLRKSEDDLVSAVMMIKGNLHEIAQGLEGILEETRNVAWASETQGLSFMEGLDSGFASVIESIQANATEQGALTDTVSSAGIMVSDMSRFVQEIEGMGLNLQLIALNARIKAAHMGIEGAALDTISGGIYELSLSAREETKTLAGLLGVMVETSAGFEKDLRGVQESQKGNVQTMVSSLNKLTSSLHTINDAVLSSLSDMTKTGEDLMKEILLMADGISLHTEVEEMLDGPIKAMAEVALQAQEMCPVRQREAAVAFLSEGDKLYTMASEREIHTRHLQGSIHTHGQVEPAAVSDDLGDNVELF